MKPIFVFTPYSMGNFDPILAGVARHTWRLLTPPLPEAPPTVRMGALGRALAAEVTAIRAEGQLPVMMVGDCTAPIGILAGLQQESQDLTLVWYDAHGDFNTHETTPSGFIGGMPLAMLCGRGDQTIVKEAGAKIHPEAQVILTDARDLDPGEKETLADSAVVHLPDVSNLIGYALPNKPIYVHFDCDVLRLSDMAAVNYPAQGGSDLATIEASLAHLAQMGRVAAVSVTMWDPELDEEGQAEQVVMDVVERFVDRLCPDA